MKMRLWWAKWQRLTRWEFWPVWAVYPPVFFSVIWEGLRLRGLTLWANCNPGMTLSGIALESKSGLLASLEAGDEGIRVARFRRVSGEGAEPVEEVKSFVREVGGFPVILKPDVGQRGQGVAIVHDEEEAREWISHCDEVFLVQEYVRGLEFGVQWARFPETKRGMIPSLCGKHPQRIQGDGKRTLKELILDDDRAVLMASYYFKKFAGELNRVLVDGELFGIAPIGTHSRGAVFTDERSLVTERLRGAFDRLGDRFPGFHLGRYDIKVPSIDDLQAGREIVVLELNGVMGEPAHIYQPGYPWWRGIRDLCRHFRLAAEIGKACCDRGIDPPELGDLLDLIRQHREKDYLEVDERWVRE